LQFIVKAGDEYEVLAVWFAQIFQRDHCGANGDEAIEHNYVVFGNAR